MTTTTAGETRRWLSECQRKEDLQLETLVKLTGLTKQDYIIRRLLERDVVVQGNPKVYKALRDQLGCRAGRAAPDRSRAKA